MNDKYIKIDIIFQYIILFVLTMASFLLKDAGVPDNWETIIGYTDVFLLAIQLITLINNKKDYRSLEFWLIAFSHLFMFGQIVLKGVFGVDQIFAMNYQRNVIDERYDDNTMYVAAWFCLCCIQAINIGLLNKSKRQEYLLRYQNVDNTYNSRLFNTGKVLLIAGLPSHIIHNARSILVVQNLGSYEYTQDYSGVLDDFANFLTISIICFLFSNKYSKNKARIILAVFFLYLVAIMILSGDRRYHVVSMLVVFLSYIKNYQFKFSIKKLGVVYLGIIVLNILTIIRNIRYGGLISVSSFFSEHFFEIFGIKNVLYQTLYEFGGSFYTVCLAIRFVPSTLGYRLGSTLISAMMGIIPFGMIYQSFPIYRYGRVAEQLDTLGRTSVGGSVFMDLYANFGYFFGIIFAFLTAVVIKIVIRKMFFRRHNIEDNLCYVQYYTLFYAIIHIVRTSYTEVLRTAVWGLFAIYIANKVFIRNRNGYTEAKSTIKV